ncbi:Uncharacterised protein [Vibrio cholerae]|nr:Uncharacterised protein [Vibrio cholerae]
MTSSHPIIWGTGIPMKSRIFSLNQRKSKSLIAAYCLPLSIKCRSIKRCFMTS